MKKKIAFITGITGQDGSYLAELLLKRTMLYSWDEKEIPCHLILKEFHIYENKKYKKRFFLHYGDIQICLRVLNLINSIRPDEIYNLQHKVMLQQVLKYQNTRQMLMP